MLKHCRATVLIAREQMQSHSESEQKWKRILVYWQSLPIQLVNSDV